MVLRKSVDHTYHQTIYESDLSKGLDIMRCSNNKVPKSVTHNVTRGRTDVKFIRLASVGIILGSEQQLSDCANAQADLRL